MKTLRMPTLIFLACCIGLLAYLACSAPLLPERMATHFGAGGQPNGWMKRSTYLAFFGAVGVGLPLLFVAFSLIVRFVPVQFINIPDREYWLGPEHREETSAYISQQLLWVGCLQVLFLGGSHFLTIQANHSAPVRLPMAGFLTVLGCFVAANAIWAFTFIRHFRKKAR
jgi:serine/threonine-protein kinase